MILLPDGKPLDVDSVITSDHLIHELGLELKSTCDAFLASPACISDSIETVHVVQGEFAEILVDQNIKVLASSDATTCLIVVFVDQASGYAAIYHHDESTVQLAENITQGIINSSMQSPDCYLVGGSAGGSTTSSENTLSTILHCLHSLPIPITLKLFCALDWNTDPITRAPRCQSLAISLRKHQQQGNVIATAFAVPPGCLGKKNNQRGPLIIPRLAQIWLRYSTNKVKLNRSVYDANTGQWALHLLQGGAAAASPASSEIITPEEKTIKSKFKSSIKRLLDLSDEELLAVCCTSPEFELPHIPGEIRKCLQWVLAQKKPLQNVEHRFQFNNKSKDWDELR
jgi:hypothetical protein